MSQESQHDRDRHRPQSGAQALPYDDATLPLEKFEMVTPAGPTLQITASWAGLIPKGMIEQGKYWTSTHIASGVVGVADKNDISFEATQQAAAEDPLIGAIVNESYEILSILGKGGMAVVYLAKQLATDRLVAMKAMKVNSAEDIMRFGREIRSHSRLRHRNIVEYMEFIATPEGDFFLVMERIKGLNLLDIIKSIGRIDGTTNIASIMLQACDALAYAHAAGVIHRDLKTSNVVLVKEDEADEIVVKILDFGIARVEGEERITFTGRAIGSPMYMSPEQCSAKTLGPRSDLYSWGVVAYEMFTGTPPYHKGSVRDIMTAHCTPDITPQPMQELVPHIPGIKMLDQIVLKALQTDPARRWNSASQMKDAFEFWYEAVNSGMAIDSLPPNMIEEPRTPATLEMEDRNFELSRKERDQIRHIKRTSTMQSSFGSGNLGDIDQARLQANEEEGSKKIYAATLQEERRTLIRMSILTGVLLVTLIAFFTINMDSVKSMFSTKKEAPVVSTKPPAPQVKPAPKKEPDKKSTKKRSRRSRKRS